MTSDPEGPPLLAVNSSGPSGPVFLFGRRLPRVPRVWGTCQSAILAIGCVLFIEVVGGRVHDGTSDGHVPNSDSLP